MRGRGKGGESSLGRRTTPPLLVGSGTEEGEVPPLLLSAPELPPPLDLEGGEGRCHLRRCWRLSSPSTGSGREGEEGEGRHCSTSSKMPSPLLLLGATAAPTARRSR
uniref:Uncharacterized protein n=1 Tax=Oryza punctata TaxID=4537 RepID=A0A0E0MD39_ORYPU